MRRLTGAIVAWTACASLTALAQDARPELEPERVLRLPGGHRTVTLASPVHHAQFARPVAAAFSGDGKHLATLSYDRELGFWDLETGELKRVAGEEDDPWTGVLSYAQGREILTHGPTRAELWDPALGRVVRELKVDRYSGPSMASWSLDGRRLVMNRRRYDLFDDAAKPVELLWEKEHLWTADSMNRIVVSTRTGFQSIGRFDLEGRELAWRDMRHRGVIRHLALSPRGRVLAVCTGGFVELLSLPHLEPAGRIETRAWRWEFLDSRFGVASERDGLALWDTEAGDRIQLLPPEHFDPWPDSLFVVVSPDRTRIAVLVRDGVSVFRVRWTRAG